MTATAHKLARLIYTLLARGTEYHDRGQEAYEARYRERTLQHLKRRAHTMGFQLIAADGAAA